HDALPISATPGPRGCCIREECGPCFGGRTPQHGPSIENDAVTDRASRPADLLHSPLLRTSFTRGELAPSSINHASRVALQIPSYREAVPRHLLGPDALLHADEMILPTALVYWPVGFVPATGAGPGYQNPDRQGCRQPPSHRFPKSK